MRQLSVFCSRTQKQFNKTVWLWRGMKNMSIDVESFMEEGGTEMAPMSTTKSEKVAKQCGPRSHPSISLRIASRLGVKFFCLGIPRLHEITTRT